MVLDDDYVGLRIVTQTVTETVTGTVTKTVTGEGGMFAAGRAPF
jgi:hypothetical protein